MEWCRGTGIMEKGAMLCNTTGPISGALLLDKWLPYIDTRVIEAKGQSLVFCSFQDCNDAGNTRSPVYNIQEDYCPCPPHQASHMYQVITMLHPWPCASHYTYCSLYIILMLRLTSFNLCKALKSSLTILEHGCQEPGHLLRSKKFWVWYILSGNVRGSWGCCMC